MAKWISELSYGTLDGIGIGLTGFDVVFGGAHLEHDSHDFADAVARILLADGKSRALRVRGTYPTDTSVYQFVKRFHDDGGWFLIGMSDGQGANLWDDMLAYRAIRLTRPEWPVLKANEIQWPGALGPEPLLPTPQPKLMLITEGMSDDAAVWRWLGEAKHPWHVLGRQIRRKV